MICSIVIPEKAGIQKVDRGYHLNHGMTYSFYFLRNTHHEIRNTTYARRITKMTAEGGSRTHTLSPGRDFESRASACSATPAVLIYYLLFIIEVMMLNNQ